jgi:hypothetical protein
MVVNTERGAFVHLSETATTLSFFLCKYKVVEKLWRKGQFARGCDRMTVLGIFRSLLLVVYRVVFPESGSVPTSVPDP